MTAWEHELIELLRSRDNEQLHLGTHIGRFCPLPRAHCGPGKLKQAIAARPHLFKLHTDRNGDGQWVSLAEL